MSAKPALVFTERRSPERLLSDSRDNFDQAAEKSKEAQTKLVTARCSLDAVMEKFQNFCKETCA